MTNTVWLDRIPLLVFFFGIVGMVLISIGIGYAIGSHRLRKTSGALAGPVGSVVGAMLGQLAFILAFTFGIATSRFDTRKQLLLDEVNALEKAYLRAGLIAEPHRSESRNLLKEYVSGRVALTDALEDVQGSLAKSRNLQQDLWSHAVALSRVNTSSEIDALFIDSLNDVFSVHTSRATIGLQYRIPMGVWIVLALLTVFAMISVGYQFGISGKSCFFAYSFLSVGFSLVVLIIADLDNPLRGRLRVNQRPMIELQERLSRM